MVIWFKRIFIFIYIGLFIYNLSIERIRTLPVNKKQIDLVFQKYSCLLCFLLCPVKPQFDLNVLRLKEQWNSFSLLWMHLC